MLDFVVSQKIDQMTRALFDLTASVGATAQILVDKGVCTEDEYLAMKSRVLAHLDQQTAEARERKLASMSPIQRSIYEAVGLDLSEEEK